MSALSDTRDASRSILVKYHSLRTDKPYAAPELDASITPYRLAEMIHREELEISVGEIVAIYEIFDEGHKHSCTNIMDAVFELVESGHFDDRDPEGDAMQIGMDNERNRRAMAGV